MNYSTITTVFNRGSKESPHVSQMTETSTSDFVNALFRVLFPRDVSSMELLQRLPLLRVQQDVRPPLPHELHGLLGGPPVIDSETINKLSHKVV